MYASVNYVSIGSDSAPGHYLNQCWLIVDWIPGKKYQWNLNRNFIIFIQDNGLEMASGMATILSRGDELVIETQMKFAPFWLF